MVEGGDPRGGVGAEEDHMREDGGEVGEEISGEESLGEKSLGEKSLGGGLKTRLKLPCKSVNSSCYQRWFT